MFIASITDVVIKVWYSMIVVLQTWIAWLCAQAEQYLAHMSGQTVNETNNELVGGMLLFCVT